MLFEKKKQKKKETRMSGSARRTGRGCNFKNSFRANVIEKVIFEQRLDGSELIGSADM